MNSKIELLSLLYICDSSFELPNKYKEYKEYQSLITTYFSLFISMKNHYLKNLNGSYLIIFLLWDIVNMILVSFI